MMIDYAILGLLSWKPLTGYDVKRMMQDSPSLYWSGSNNQIFKALVNLLDNGFVTNKIQYQESAQTKRFIPLRNPACPNSSDGLPVKNQKYLSIRKPFSYSYQSK